MSRLIDQMMFERANNSIAELVSILSVLELTTPDALQLEYLREQIEQLRKLAKVLSLAPKSSSGTVGQ